MHAIGCSAGNFDKDVRDVDDVVSLFDVDNDNDNYSDHNNVKDINRHINIFNTHDIDYRNTDLYLSDYRNSDQNFSH